MEEHCFLENSFGRVNGFLDFSVRSSMVWRERDMLKVPFLRKCLEI